METKNYPVIWFQAAGCTGCSVSILNTSSFKVKHLLLDELVPGKYLSFQFQPTIMAGSGEKVINVLKRAVDAEKEKYILIVEGALPFGENGTYGTIGEDNGREIPMVERFESLARNCFAVVALGDCSSFGGIPGAYPNPTGIKSVEQSLKDFNIDKPFINIPGCPPHPDWLIGTVTTLILGQMPLLDDLHRPKEFYGGVIHDNCPRRGDFDAGRFARSFGEEGCLYLLGCKGHFAYADCPTRQWNSGINWCIKNGAPCLACVEPDFPDGACPFYEKLKDFPKIG
jgi:hydrogenase small subunit